MTLLPPNLRRGGLRRSGDAGPWGRRALTAGLVSTVVGAWPAPAAAGVDFDAASSDWNGLSVLMSTASKIDVQLVPEATLDWSHVSERDVMLLVGPAAAPTEEDQVQLRAFFRAGGRMVLADDFRAGSAWLAGTGISWLDMPVMGEPVAFGNPAFPLAEIASDPASEEAARRWQAPQARLTATEFLGHNLAKPVVLNHPAALQVQGDGEAVLWGPFSGGDSGWLAEARVFSGRVLAISDSSILINQMLRRVYENRQFAANVLRYYCVVDRPCRVRLYAGLQTTIGAFAPQHRAPPTGWRAGLVALSEALAGLADLLRGPFTAPALVAGLLAILGLPVLQRARMRGPELPPRGQPWRRSSAVAQTVQAWLASPDADYRKPARLLASQLSRWLERSEWSGEAAPSMTVRTTQRKQRPTRRDAGLVDGLVQGGKCSPQTGQRLREVLNNLQQATQDQGPPVTRRQFGQLSAEVEWAESLLRHTLQSSRASPARDASALDKAPGPLADADTGAP